MADLHPPSALPNGGLSENMVLSLGTKRQRRPSVRLGEIGEPSGTAAVSDDGPLRKNKQWKTSAHIPPTSAGKAVKNRRLLGNGDSQFAHQLFDEKIRFGAELDPSTGARKGKRGPPALIKRPRTNWVSRVDEEGAGEHEKSNGEGEGAGEDGGFQDFEAEGSETPSKKENSPNSGKGPGCEKEGIFPRKGIRGKFPEFRESDGVELGVASDGEGGDWTCGGSLERNLVRERRCPSLDNDGVRNWLNRLGLGRYEQMFDIHEVDEEVLPLLTFEDLKDMGINAVGSRRKMYCSIQKLRKGFS